MNPIDRNRLNRLLGAAVEHGGPGLAYRDTAERQNAATFVSEAVPMRYSRRPGTEFTGDAGSAQTFPTLPSLADSVDLGTGNGSAQLSSPRVPYRTVPIPIP